MLRTSLQTLRARRASLTGAFVAILLAVTLAAATGSLFAAALSAPGPGRFAGADAVVRADPTVKTRGADPIDVIPAPRLDRAMVDRAAHVPGVSRATADLAFPVSVRGTHTEVYGHLAGRDLGPRELLADARLGLRRGDTVAVSAAGGEARFRVAGSTRGAEDSRPGVAFADATARRLSGDATGVDAIAVKAAHGTSPAVLRERLQDTLGAQVDVLDRRHAADADAGDPRAEDREALIAIFATMGGISGAVALFVVAGTFSLTLAQRRREMAVMRALGATPAQVRRLVSLEALTISLVAGALGLAAGVPVAEAIVRVLRDHGIVPHGFTPEPLLLVRAAAVGLGVVVAQLAVVAAARRAGRTRPADALREAAVEHARPSVPQLVTGVLALGGGVAMTMVFDGFWAQAFAALTGILLAAGVGLLGRGLLGLPAAALAWPLRRLGAAGLLASTSVAANRWRTAALATPLVLIAMLAGSQGLVQSSAQRDAEDTTGRRTLADQVVTGRDGAPVPAAAAREVAQLPGVRAVAATVPTQVFGSAGLGEQSPWKAVGLDPRAAGRTLDLGVVAGDLGGVQGQGVAVSRWVAHDGHLRVGSPVRLRMEDTRTETFRVAAIYDRAAGLGDVVLPTAAALRHAAVPAPDALYVDGGPDAARSLRRFAAGHPGVAVADRATFQARVESSFDEQAWAIWMILGVSVLFAALALVNTAAMSTAERRRELATIRLLGGTGGHVVRMVVLELLPTLVIALAAGTAIVVATVAGVPRGVSGVPLTTPVELIGAIVGGAALLTMAAGAVSARLALSAAPAGAIGARE